jgi:hypothetical protein
MELASNRRGEEPSSKEKARIPVRGVARAHAHGGISVNCKKLPAARTDVSQLSLSGGAGVRAIRAALSKASLLWPDQQSLPVRAGISARADCERNLIRASFRKHRINASPPSSSAPGLIAVFRARARAFLLVNSLTSRRHSAAEALTGSAPASCCARKSLPSRAIFQFSRRRKRPPRAFAPAARSRCHPRLPRR